MGRDAMLLQSSLRDSIMFHDVPRTASWAKFSRPFGTSLETGCSRRGFKPLRATRSTEHRRVSLRFLSCSHADSKVVPNSKHFEEYLED